MIRVVLNFEFFCEDNGTLIQSYLADNGMFKGKVFIRHIRESN